MKKVIMISMMFLLPLCGWAGKKLVSITMDDGSRVQSGTIEYDEQDRVVRYVVQNSNGNSYEYTGTYIGDEKIEVYDSRNEKQHTFTMENGRLTAATLFFDQFGLSWGSEVYPASISYDGNKIVRVANVDDYGVGTMAWNGDNPSEWYSYDSSGKEREHTIYTYNTLATHPIMHAIFGFWYSEPSMHDLFESLFLYPYYGDLPKGLFEKIVYTENQKDTFEYDFTYETNADGDVVKAIVTRGSKVKTYTFEWEGTSAINSVTAAQTGTDTFYSLDGQHFNNTPGSGLVIVRHSDGTVAKVIMRK